MSFSRKYDWYDHSKELHGIKLQKSYKLKLQCPLCKDFSYEKPTELNEHVASVHDGEDPFKCNECSKTFKCQSGLKNHKKAIHEGRKFMCQTCGKSYVGKWGLQTHIGMEIQISFSRI